MRWPFVLPMCALVLGLSACIHLPRNMYIDNNGNWLPLEGSVNVLAQDIAQDLLRHHNELDLARLTAVTTPVLLDDFGQSSRFSLQLGEALIASLHQQGIRLVELNSTNSLRVTEQGNFALTRDFEQLIDSLPVEQLVVATISSNHQQVEIQTRILQVSDQRVLSAVSHARTWQQLPQYFAPAQKISLGGDGLYRYEQADQGRIIEREAL